MHQPNLNILSSVPGLVPESGGPCRTTTALCSALASNGVGVELLSLNFGKKFGVPIMPSSELVKTFLAPCYSRKLRPFWAPQFQKIMLERLRCSQARLIHDNGVWLITNHTAATVARRCGLPLVLSTRGMLTSWSIRHNSFRKRVAWKMYQHEDLLSVRVFHATAEAEADGIRQLGFKQPIAIIPNGVEVPSAPRQGLCDSGKKTALFLGRIHPVKGLTNLVAAWARVRPVGWQMILAGPDEQGHQSELVRAIDEAGLTDAFVFPGWVEGQQKADLLARADLFIAPSFSENFCVAVAEALAHGIPVITTKGTPWQDIEKRGCGWWVGIGTEPLRDALEAAISRSDSERAEMGSRGRSLAQESYSWIRIATEMRSVYEWVLGSGTKPDCVHLN